jgi:hypothetical protein
VRFNNDFVLQFVSDRERLHIDGRAYCAPVLQNTIGVDVFVTVDNRTDRPYQAELLDGEAFSMNDFKEHIDNIEHHLARLRHPLDLKKTTYCRVFVIENDICFLAFPNARTPVLRGTRSILYDNGDASIACSAEGGEIVYVDGWIKTFVPVSERKLEAIPVNPEKN